MTKQETLYFCLHRFIGIYFTCYLFYVLLEKKMFTLFLLNELQLENIDDWNRSEG